MSCMNVSLSLNEVLFILTCASQAGSPSKVAQTNTNAYAKSFSLFFKRGLQLSQWPAEGYNNPDSEPALILGGIRPGNPGHCGIRLGKGWPRISPWYEQWISSRRV